MQKGRRVNRHSGESDFQSVYGVRVGLWDLLPVMLQALYFADLVAVCIFSSFFVVLLCTRSVCGCPLLALHSKTGNTVTSDAVWG